MSSLKKLIILLLDIASLYAALAIMVTLRYPGDFHARFNDHLWPFSFIFFLWIIVFYLADLYRHRTLRSRSVFFRSLVPAIVVANLVSVVAFYLLNGAFQLTPKTNLFVLSIIFLLIEYLWRTLLFRALRDQSEGVILIGTSPLVHETVAHLAHNPETGYYVSFWIKDPKDLRVETIAEKMKEKGIYMVVVEPQLTKDSGVIRNVYRLLPLGVQIVNFSDFYETIFEKAPLDELEEGWFLEHVTTRRPMYETIKRALDLSVATIAFVIAIPFAIVISIGIRLTSAGPVIYTQTRVGKNGRRFTLYKFRSMRNGHNGPLWTEAGDNRITPFGKLLRRTHLDELPQILNVLKGDISLTGPRPERVELVAQYETFPYYELRHAVVPGLTGWAQINFKPSASLEEGYEKLWYDIFYIEHRSLLLDLLILLRTTKHLFLKSE